MAMAYSYFQISEIIICDHLFYQKSFKELTRVITNEEYYQQEISCNESIIFSNKKDLHEANNSQSHLSIKINK